MLIDWWERNQKKLIKWCGSEKCYKEAKIEDNKIKLIHYFIEQRGETAKIHRGHFHNSRQRTVNKHQKIRSFSFGSYYVYAIYNSISLQKTKKIFGTGALKQPIRSPEPIIYDPQWIKAYILSPINLFTYNYIVNETTNPG